MHNIEIRDEIYRNIHNLKPSWWMKWGIAMVFFIIFLLFTLSYFVQYSEIVTAKVRISSKVPSVTIPAKTSASITAIEVKDGTLVKKDQYLVVLLNSANHKDVIRLKEKLIKKMDLNQLLEFYENEGKSPYVLGSIQPHWDNLMEYLLEYYEIVRVNKYDKKIDMLKEEIQVLEKRNIFLKKKVGLNDEVSELIEKDFDMSSSLHKEAVISNSDYNSQKRQYLETQKSFENERIAYNQNQFDIARINNTIQELKESKREAIERLTLQMYKSLNLLKSSIALWEEANVLKSPIVGKVNYLMSIKENQYINQGTFLLAVTPEVMEYQGIVEIPFAGAGKIEAGQNVNIKLEDYPYHEYGLLKGKIDKVSDVANENYYIGQVSLANRTVTSYKKPIVLNENARGIAEIIIKRRSLLGRIFDKILYLFNQ